MSELTGEKFEQRYYEAQRLKAISHRLGVQSVHQHVEVEYIEGLERRRRDEIVSGLGEGLKGSVSTKYEFELKEDKLVAEDGEPIEDMLWRALDDANELTSQDSFYSSFLVQRTQHELTELVEQEAMARGERDFNTIVTFSPYTEELHTPETEQKITIAGQKPYWKRGMIRVSHWDGQQLHIFTRSIDNSSVTLFRDIARDELGYGYGQVDSTAMLGERIHMKHDGEAWTEIADNLVAAADRRVTAMLGEETKQGIPRSRTRDTMTYVRSQQNIIEHLLQQDRILALQYEQFDSWKHAFEGELRKHVALLDMRMSEGVGTVLSDRDIAAAADSAGMWADAAGKSYDMCGYVLGSKAAAIARNTGFESLARLAGQKVECPNCEKKVVVPADKLGKGHLYCTECHLDVDVCTGKSKITKPQPASRPKRAKKTKTPAGRKYKWWEIPPA